MITLYMWSIYWQLPISATPVKDTDLTIRYLLDVIVLVNKSVRRNFKYLTELNIFNCFLQFSLVSSQCPRYLYYFRENMYEYFSLYTWSHFCTYSKSFVLNKPAKQWSVVISIFLWDRIESKTSIARTPTGPKYLFGVLEVL